MDAGKRRGRSRTRSKRKKRTFRRRKGGPAPRPYKTDKKSRAKRRFTRPRHKKSTVHGHHKRRLQEAQLTNDLLTMMLKAQKPGAMPRHHSNDPEYAFSSPRMQEFKRGFAAPDTNFWRPQGHAMPPHRANFPGWKPEWVHTYQHPHEG